MTSCALRRASVLAQFVRRPLRADSGVAFILPPLRDGGKNDRGARQTGQLCNRAQRGIQKEAGEQDEAGIAIGLEDGEAIVGRANVEAGDLPG